MAICDYCGVDHSPSGYIRGLYRPLGPYLALRDSFDAAFLSRFVLVPQEARGEAKEEVIMLSDSAPPQSIREEIRFVDELGRPLDLPRLEELDELN